jgi:UDP-N-acetylmuramoylalanine--D-glutamate ligase
MVTNLAPDHIDWHGSYEEYIAAKAKILQTGTPERSAIVQESELGLLLGERNPGFKLFAFSWGPLSGAKENMIIADDAARIVALVEDGGETRTLFSFDEVPMIGRHNIENAAFAAGAVHLLTGCGAAEGDLFKGFKGLPHRCEFVATVDGVDYVDDSKGTNVAASATALASLSRPKVVILGGQGKGEDYAPLAEAVKREALAAVVLGSEREKIVKALRDAGYPSVHEVASMEEAVALSARLAPRGGLVLLSPACTSWDMYSDYKQRGLHFRRIVQALKDEEAP